MTRDIHCVTRWSKFDTSWEGVSVDTLLDAADADAAFVVAFCDGGYTTNLPVEDITGGKAWIVFAYDGDPLEPEHGGPARLLVPHLYFWKSAKWVRGLELREEDEPGFWETYGYHLYGDPWREPAILGRLNWARAVVAAVTQETSHVRTLVLDIDGWSGHRAGQHLDVRLTAEDGYRAERAYSIATAPGEAPAITVERLADGEVSPYLTEVVRPGDVFDVRAAQAGSSPNASSTSADPARSSAAAAAAQCCSSSSSRSAACAASTAAGSPDSSPCDALSPGVTNHEPPRYMRATNQGIGRGTARARRISKNVTLVNVSVVPLTRDVQDSPRARTLKLALGRSRRRTRKLTGDPLLWWAAIGLSVGERPSTAAVAVFRSELESDRSSS